MTCTLVSCWNKCSVGQRGRRFRQQPPGGRQHTAAVVKAGRRRERGREGPHSRDQMTSLLQLMFSGAQTQGEGSPSLSAGAAVRHAVVVVAVAFAGRLHRVCLHQGTDTGDWRAYLHSNAQFLYSFLLCLCSVALRPLFQSLSTLVFAPLFQLPHLPPPLLTCPFSCLFSLSLTPSPLLFLLSLSLCSAAR